jgi:hypothetical protein
MKMLSATRLAVLSLGAGVVGLGVDAGIAHFAGREMKTMFQLVPVVAGLMGFVALAAVALLRSREHVFRTALRVAGALIALVGVAGTMLHGRQFMMLMEGVEVTMENIEVALRIAPPLAAPGAFIAVGALLALLASPRVSLRILPAARGTSRVSTGHGASSASHGASAA